MYGSAVAGVQPTPEDLARELGTTGRQIRGFLRARFARPEFDKGTRWDLSADQVAEIRAVLGGRMRGQPRDGGSQARERVHAPKREAAGPYHDQWFWEGRVQDSARRYLLAQGWTVSKGADTASRTPGDDLVAARNGETMVVEVKGYPPRGYADPRRSSEVKPTSATSQAHHWFGQAILRTMRTINRRPPVTVAMAFPAKPRYEDLLAETWSAISRLRITVFLVHEDNSVSVYTGPGRQTSHAQRTWRGNP